MPDPAWERIKDIFGRAQQAPVEDRPRLLDAACAGDDHLKAEVESLLTWDAGADDFLDSRQLQQFHGQLDDDDEQGSVDALVGCTLGAYRIVGRLAEGGMGTVYRAARADHAFDKIVAIKVIRRGLHTDQVVARFEQERRALASLEHPNIARLIDGGTTPDGLPYFVMEFVAGVPIDTYCDEHRRTVSDRLQLFRQVCSGVAHAHRNLIVHRDLKPANILVGIDGVPKLLDFGIATLLQSEGTEVSESAPLAMTPGFASPEQRRHVPVTTATDVYSLGVTLYRLLTGRMPGPRVLDAGVAGTGGTVVRPSDAVATDDRAAEIAQRRGLSPGGLQRRLAGDLDAIVLKALRDDPDERYSSVDELSEDLQRYLESRPVIARPATMGYRAARFARRYRTAVSLAGVTALAVIVGAAGIVWQAQVAARERNEARVQAVRAERVSTLLSELLQSPDPLKQGRDVRVVDVLEDASRRIDRDLTDDPAVRAALLLAVGKAFMSIGVLDRAEEHIRRALDLRLNAVDQAPAPLAATYAELGAVLRTKGELQSAEAPMRRALDLYRRAFGAEHVEVASVLNQLGGLLQERGELDAAERMHRESLAMRQKLLGPRHRDVADSLNDLGVVLGSRGDFMAAEPLHREALAIARAVQGPRHPDVASTMMTLAFVREMNGDPADAARLYRDALDIRREALGNTHPDTAWTMYSYAAFLRAQRDPEHALPLLREVLALRGRTLPDGHLMVGSALYELGRVLQAVGDHRAAAAALREGLTVRRAALGAGHWLVRSAESSLGESIDAVSAGSREAERLLVPAFEALQTLKGPAHPATSDALARIIRYYERAGRTREADRYRKLRPVNPPVANPK